MKIAGKLKEVLVLVQKEPFSPSAHYFLPPFFPPSFLLFKIYEDLNAYCRNYPGVEVKMVTKQTRS